MTRLNIETPPAPDRPYRCTEAGCTRAFVRSEHLSRHRLNHRPRKVFTCTICPKKFVRPDLYARHKARHEKGMLFRNTGGVVEENVDAQSTASLTVAQSDSGVEVEVVEYSPNAQNNQLPSDGTPTDDEIAVSYEVESTNPNHLEGASGGNIPTLNYNYGSPADDPQTLFYDDTANIWDLPDDLRWFFDPPEASPNRDGSSSIYPQYPSLDSSLFTVSDSMVLTSYTFPGSTHWVGVQSRLMGCLFSLPPDLLQSQFFAPDNLALCWDLYFENYHPHFPFLHRPTLSPLEAEPLLIASIIVLGSTLASDDTIFQLGQRIHDVLRWIIFQTGKFKPPSPLWCLQALLLVQAQAKMFSTREHHEMAHIFHGAILTMMKRGKAYSPNWESENSQYNTLELSWREWAQQESGRRTAFFAFIMDAQHSSVFGHTPVLSVSDIRLPLPCPEPLWETSSPVRWQTEFQHAPKPIQFLPTLKSLLTTKLTPPGCTAFSRFILLHGLFSLTTYLRAHEDTTLGIGTGKGAKDGIAAQAPIDDWVQVICGAIDTWSFSLLSLEPSMCLEAAKPLHRMAYITLFANISDFHILAKDPILLKNCLTKKEWDKAVARLTQRNKHEDATRAVYHSLLLVKETAFSGKKYLAREDNVAARPWCLYNAILVLWGYGQIVPLDSDGSVEVPMAAEEYIGRMLSGMDGKRDVVMFAKNTHGLLHSMQAAFQGCRWELLEEAYQTLGRLISTNIV